MSNLPNEERVIDLKDMFYHVLKQWRKIINGAIVIALLFGLYKVYAGVKVLVDDEALAEAQDKYEITLNDYWATGERLKTRIETLRERSAHQQEYNDKSVKMKIDPMNKWIGIFQIYIDSKYQIDPSLTFQNVDMTKRLVSAYTSYLRSGELYQDMLSHTSEIDEIRFLTEIYNVSADPENATITVTYIDVSEANVRSMLDFVQLKIAEQFKTVQNAIGDHSYGYLTESIYSTIDLDLEATQKDNLLSISEYANAIGEVNAELTDWEKESEPKPEYGVKYTVIQAIKFIIIGGVIGVLCMAAWLAIKYISSGTINSDLDLAIFQVPVLGKIKLEKEQKNFLPKLDVCFDRLCDRVNNETTEQSCILAAQSVSAALKNLQIKESALTGGLSRESAEQYVSKMNSAGTGISFRFVGDVLDDPTASIKMADSEGTLIFIERYKTKIADLNQTLTLLKAWGKKALGLIMVE